MTGATGATGATVQISGRQIQLQDPAAVSVASGTPVLFDTTVSVQSLFIAYNALTGTITITETGIFYINWWVSIDGMSGGADLIPTFSIIISEGDNIRASIPNVTGQLSGNALL